ncbi:MAG TPA: KpsF/GutQ family sugar-phosphate isomerase [Nitrospirae bacterium]|nr:KpsF/GutQ family sugar-phosphate isomerase [Nitrospirota bacterium]
MFIEQAKKVLEIESAAISALIDRIDDNFLNAIDIIYSCNGRVVVTGMGKSGLIGKKITSTLASTGTPALFLHPAEGGHGDLGMVTKGDVVIALSNSGETEEIIMILPTLKRLEIKLIALTGNTESRIARAADVVLDVSVKEEACPMGLAPTASTTALLAIGDALAVTVLSKRGFKEEDFAFFHPGGNLGRRLLMSIDEIMHTGTEIPAVNFKTLMKDAIMEISSKRMGITTVTDNDSRLLGIITDGDLRRGLEKFGEKLFSLKAEDVIAYNPKTLTRDVLAVKAVEIMEQHSITSLVILDPDGRAEGIVHLHDLLKSGVV